MESVAPVVLVELRAATVVRPVRMPRAVRAATAARPVRPVTAAMARPGSSVCWRATRVRLVARAAMVARAVPVVLAGPGVSVAVARRQVLTVTAAPALRAVTPVTVRPVVTVRPGPVVLRPPIRNGSAVPVVTAVLAELVVLAARVA